MSVRGSSTAWRSRVGARAGAVYVALVVGVALVSPPTQAAKLPASISADAIRDLSTQHDGRWPPLDTVARDLVRSVTGEIAPDGADPVLLLLAWTFAPETWMREPLIHIPNAELRGVLQLPTTKSVFSYEELMNHERLRTLIDEQARAGMGKKSDPLQSKVRNIHEKLSTLQRVFGGRAIRLVPEPKELTGAWRTIGAPQATDSAALTSARNEWNRLREAFVSDQAAPFSAAAANLKAALASLPAAYRPTDRAMSTELRYNRLRPFHSASLFLLLAAGFAAMGMLVRKKWFDGVVIMVILVGFGVLTYGLSLRWQIAGRIPASNMFESLLFLSWGAALFAIVSMLVFRERLVPLTAAGMSALALFLADRLPMDQFVRPIAPVLLDTVWMSIHVPIIMVSYSVLALGVLVAHVQLVVMAVAPARRSWIESIDHLHYWYIQVGSILLAAGIITGSMWAACSWGRYWGWDPKEVWSLVALLGYLTILHVRINHERVPRWFYAVGAALIVAVLVVVVQRLAPITTGKLVGLGGAAVGGVILIGTRGAFATAAKSVLCFWLIIMTYVGVNYVLGAGLHSYGFGTGAVAKHMFQMGGADLGLVLICTLVYLLRRPKLVRVNAIGPVVVA